MAADFVARLGSRASDPREVRSAWGLDDYVVLLRRDDDLGAELDQMVRRDARRLRRLDPERLLALLHALADPPSAELNKARLAEKAGIPATTITPYLDVAADLGLIRLLPGSRALVAKRAIGRPRAVFADPALGRHFAGDAAEGLARLDARGRLAPHLQGIVITELLRQQEAGDGAHRVAHLRERNGLRVDVVIELPDDTVYALQVRTAAALRPHQYDDLELLAARAGWRLRLGIVLNTASVGHRYRPDLWSLPISSLWDWAGE